MVNDPFMVGVQVDKMGAGWLFRERVYNVMATRPFPPSCKTCRAPINDDAVGFCSFYNNENNVKCWPNLM